MASLLGMKSSSLIEPLRSIMRSRSAISRFGCFRLLSSIYMIRIMKPSSSVSGVMHRLCESVQFLGVQMPGFGEKCVHLQPVSPRQGVAACRRPRQGRIPYAAIIVSAGAKNLSQPPSLLDRHNERHQYHCPRSLLRLR